MWDATEIMRRFVLAQLIAALGIAGTLATWSLAEQECIEPCECTVVPAQGEWRYSRRGDRCEGRYNQPISSRKQRQLLRLASFTQGNIVSSAGKVLPLTWSKRNEALRLAAAPIVPNLFYRMDTAIAANSQSFNWNLEVVKATHVDLHELGYVLKTSQDLYVPVRSAGSESLAAAYSFVVAPRIVVKSLKAQVLDSAGQPVDAPPVPSVTIARDGAVAFTIPAPHAAGVFTLHLEAKCLEGCDGKDALVVSEHAFQIP